MQSTKDFFLSSLGIVASIPVIANSEILIQRAKEPEPFGHIYTKKDGSTVLRVGSNLEADGYKVIIP